MSNGGNSNGSCIAAIAKPGSKCGFCNDTSSDDMRMGQLYALDSSRAFHHYCLLFSSGLQQEGEDEEGILGFLEPDIKKELSRGRRLPCSYCNKGGATVGCSNTKCRRTYHMPCGVGHGAQFSFEGQFRTWCSQHRTYQEGPGLSEHNDCPICMEDLLADSATSVWAPCCRRESWFHKTCVQRLAISAGYFFKCPLCNDKNIFIKTMQEYGIYVPEKDASWELEPNAYQELLQRPVNCDAPICFCPAGRKHDKDGSPWELVFCQLCGSHAIHVRCKSLVGVRADCDWHCPECMSLLTESVSREKAEARARRLQDRLENTGSDDGENVDDQESFREEEEKEQLDEKRGEEEETETLHSRVQGDLQGNISDVYGREANTDCDTSAHDELSETTACRPDDEGDDLSDDDEIFIKKPNITANSQKINFKHNDSAEVSFLQPISDGERLNENFDNCSEGNKTDATNSGDTKSPVSISKIRPTSESKSKSNLERKENLFPLILTSDTSDCSDFDDGVVNLNWQGTSGISCAKEAPLDKIGELMSRSLSVSTHCSSTPVRSGSSALSPNSLLVDTSELAESSCCSPSRDLSGDDVISSVSKSNETLDESVTVLHIVEFPASKHIELNASVPAVTIEHKDTVISELLKTGVPPLPEPLMAMKTYVDSFPNLLRKYKKTLSTLINVIYDKSKARCRLSKAIIKAFLSCSLKFEHMILLKQLFCATFSYIEANYAFNQRGSKARAAKVSRNVVEQRASYLKRTLSNLKNDLNVLAQLYPADCPSAQAPKTRTNKHNNSVSAAEADEDHDMRRYDWDASIEILTPDKSTSKKQRFKFNFGSNQKQNVIITEDILDVTREEENELMILDIDAPYSANAVDKENTEKVPMQLQKKRKMSNNESVPSSVSAVKVAKIWPSDDVSACKKHDGAGETSEDEEEKEEDEATTAASDCSGHTTDENSSPHGKHSAGKEDESVVHSPRKNRRKKLLLSKEAAKEGTAATKPKGKKDKRTSGEGGEGVKGKKYCGTKDLHKTTQVSITSFFTCGK